ncbi:MAG: helix-turn-helix transcriptional regulator [Bacteroidota bacterium]
MSDNLQITSSSGNVFEDLGFGGESKYLLAKSRLMHGLAQYIRAKGWTQVQAAETFGVHQPVISNLVNGKLSQFTMDRLLKMAEHAGIEFDVRLIGLETA